MYLVFIHTEIKCVTLNTLDNVLVKRADKLSQANMSLTFHPRSRIWQSEIYSMKIVLIGI